MRIKGSGSDLATATARDFPGLWLDDLLPLREREAMSDEEMVAYLARCLVEPGRAAAVDRDAAARVPAGGARRPRPRRRDLLARERARSRRRRCARRSATTSRSCRTCGRGSSSRSASPTSPDARAVVLAHHGLVTWGETHEESYGLTLELVERARDVPRRAAAAAERREPTAARRDVPGAAPRPPLARAAAACSRVDRASGARRPRRRRRARGDAQHARPHAPDRRPHLRCSALDGDGRGSDGAPRRSSSRGLGARRRRRRTSRRVRACGSSSPRTRTRSVAATLDRFGGASWLDDGGGRRLRALAARAPQADARCRRRPSSPATSSLVTGAASGIGRDVARRPRRRAARTSCSPTATRRARGARARARRRSPATSPTRTSSTALVAHGRRELRRPRRRRPQRRHRLDRAARRARRRGVGAQPRRQPDGAVPAHAARRWR